jgi:hypothetical protein
VTPPERPPPRQRVTRPTTPYTTRSPVEVEREIDEQTPVGEVYMRSLMRSQLRLALGTVAVLAGTVGALPLLFATVPWLRTTRLLGAPLPWLVLGVGVYPVLLALAWSYVRRAEANERSFDDLVGPR